MDEEKAKKKFGGSPEEGQALLAWMKKQAEGEQEEEQEEQPEENEEE